jgi:hypothetical protein
MLTSLQYVLGNLEIQFEEKKIGEPLFVLQKRKQNYSKLVLLCWYIIWFAY